MRLCRLLFILNLFFLSLQLNAQQAISFKPIIYGYHPYDDLNNQLATKKTGPAGTFAIEPGLILGYENYFINPFMGVKANLAFYLDNSEKKAGFAHLGFRIRTFSDKQSFSLSLGPTYFIRESWSDIEGYVQDDKLNNNGKTEAKFVILSGEFEYTYAINSRNRLMFTFSQINVKAFSFTIGYSYWIDKTKKNRRKYKRKSKYYKRRKRRTR